MKWKGGTLVLRDVGYTSFDGIYTSRLVLSGYRLKIIRVLLRRVFIRTAVVYQVQCFMAS